MHLHPHRHPSSSKGFTLLEMTVVILVMLTLIKVGLITSSKVNEWRLGRTASEELRSAWSAQRMYLSDNPTATLASITPALLIPYLPSGATTMPVVRSLTGSNLTIFVGASPPYFTTTSTSSGASLPARYDPSGSTTDLLWDVGE